MTTDRVVYPHIRVETGMVPGGRRQITTGAKVVVVSEDSEIDISDLVQEIAPVLKAGSVGVLGLKLLGWELV